MNLMIFFMFDTKIDGVKTSILDVRLQHKT